MEFNLPIAIEIQDSPINGAKRAMIGRFLFRKLHRLLKIKIQEQDILLKKNFESDEIKQLNLMLEHKIRHYNRLKTYDKLTNKVEDNLITGVCYSYCRKNVEKYI